MTIVEALKIFVPLIGAIIGLIAAYIHFVARPSQNMSEKKLDRKLQKLLSEGRNNHTNTKHYRTIKKKLRGIDKDQLDRALRRVATSGLGSDGKETWTLD